MQEKEFSLLEEPWIAVVGTDDLMKKVSLTQALLQGRSTVTGKLSFHSPSTVPVLL